jgi:hypothetical protein
MENYTSYMLGNPALIGVELGCGLMYMWAPLSTSLNFWVSFNMTSKPGLFVLYTTCLACLPCFGLGWVIEPIYFGWTWT